MFLEKNIKFSKWELLFLKNELLKSVEQKEKKLAINKASKSY